MDVDGKMTEHEIQSSFFAVIQLNAKKHKWLDNIFAVPNGGKRHVSVAVKLKREGVKAGVWDVFLPSPQPGGNGLAGIWIEFKTGRNKLTDSQKQFRDGLGETCEFAVCYSVDEGLEAVEKFLGIGLTK